MKPLRARLRASKLLAGAALTFTFACGGGGDGGPGPTAPPTLVPTSISLTPATLTFTFLGQSLTLQGSIRDQNGGTVTGVIIWGSSAPAIVTVSTSGVVTSVANGTAQITATFGSLTASASATVQQVASQLVAAVGDGQVGTVGQALAQPLSVQANDQGGSPVEGAGLTFAVASGGGTLSATTGTTGADGRASTGWTLGTTAGAQSVTASVTSNSAVITTFTASGLADGAAALSISSGDAQSGPRGQALASPVVALVADQHGNPVSGQAVAFGVTGGGGTVNPAVATTSEDGTASTTWTLGPLAGANTLAASVIGLSDADFTAIATELAELSVANLVADPALSTTTQDVVITATVTNSGGGPTGFPVMADLQVDGMSVSTVDVGVLAAAEQGAATFTLSALTEGSHTLVVTVDPANQITEDDETNNTVDGNVTTVAPAPLADGVPATSLAGGAGSQTYFTFDVPLPAASASGTTSTSNTLTVTLSGGAGDADLFVRFGKLPTPTDFDCSSVTGGNAESCVIDDPAGGTWFAMLSGASAFSGVTLDLTVVQPPPPGAFTIELVFISPISDGVRAAFEAAKSRWQTIIQGDVPDIDFALNPLAADDCTIGQPEVNDVVDDIRIFVKVFEIDGPLGVLGQAGFCVARELPNPLPGVGVMSFDEADLDRLAADGRLTKVILHEMGHVLGIGSLWSMLEMVINPSLPNFSGTDTYFRGQLAIAAFDAAGGTAYTGKKVPVENQLGRGSGDVHWRESVMKTELMTPILNGGDSAPLSAVSAESLADMGYVVNSAQADDFTLTFPAATAAKTQPGSIRFENDVLKGPIYVVDKNGRIVRIIR
jgi:CARDB/Bacterial pre-peptidase C-terminal domain/Bacterial Ig-like domain/Leishmanolysin